MDISTFGNLAHTSSNLEVEKMPQLMKQSDDDAMLLGAHYDT